METTKSNRYGDFKCYRPAIKTIIKDVYHYWLNAIPSNYPPNLHSRVESKDGAIYKRDYQPAIGIGKEDYRRFNACDTKYVEIIWEFTPNGYALHDRMVLQLTMKEREATYWSFGSCNACWKQKRRDFSNNAITRHPLRVQADNPSLPRLGRCGCVVCNKCVMEIEMHENNRDKMDVHCPYCGNEDCFSKHMRIWVVSNEVSNLNY
jgi:hypothetical protein